MFTLDRDNPGNLVASQIMGLRNPLYSGSRHTRSVISSNSSSRVSSGTTSRKGSRNSACSNQPPLRQSIRQYASLTTMRVANLAVP